MAVKSCCCSERDNRFPSITQSRKECRGLQSTHSVLLSRVEAHIGEVQEEMAKALTFISYFTFISHNNPEVNVTAPFFAGRIGDSGRLS